MWVALAPILMLFLAFTSAYVVRHGLAQDWTRVEIPRLLWINTLVLLLSSAALQRARALSRAGDSARPWTLLTLLLGLGFVAGQVMAWQELRAHGIGIASSPYSSFFYLLTGAHGVHLAGGLLGLAAAGFWPTAGARAAHGALVLRLAAIYWHFMGALWLGLFALLNFWR
jgi:cytochrome c oxidase subunit 3